MQEELTPKKQILSISQLNKFVKKTLETSFQSMWIEGEVSNLTKPQSGHLYFTLKDSQAQVRCALFRTQHRSMSIEPINGMHVLAFAKITLYEGRGDYQLIIEYLEECGEGILRKRFELLKQKLLAEGLFDPIHKKMIPKHPRQIGIITSPTGAAARDVLSVLKRRFPAISVILYPTLVQGDQAAKNIVQAIELANKHHQCDVLIICRGGGSLEDLWPFNEEIVAKAIFASKLPIVSGVGHEIDYTIADFVADQRASTPSAAAELVSPDSTAYQQKLLHLLARLNHLILVSMRQRKIELSSLAKQLVRPDGLFLSYMQTIDLIEQTTIYSIHKKLEQSKNQLTITRLKLLHLSPIRVLLENKNAINDYSKKLTELICHQLNESKTKLHLRSRMLETVSPLNTLSRGYSITTKQNHVIDEIRLINPGDRIRVELKTGYLHCDVLEVEDKRN